MIRKMARALVLKYRTSNPKKYWEDDYDKNPDFMKDGWSKEDRLPQRTALEDVLATHVKSGGVILEVGANKGYYTNLMRSWGYDVKQTDIISSIEDCEQYDVSEGKLGEFDAVVGMGVFHHVFDDARAKQAIKNLCEQAPVVVLASKFVEGVYDSEIWRSRRLETIAEWLPLTHRVHSLVFPGRLDLLVVKKVNAVEFDSFYSNPMEGY